MFATAKAGFTGLQFTTAVREVVPTEDPAAGEVARRVGETLAQLKKDSDSSVQV